MSKDWLEEIRQEINHIPIRSEQLCLLNRYHQFLNDLDKDSKNEEIVHQKIEAFMKEIYTSIEHFELENRSNYSFPNHLVKFYPAIREEKCAKEITCCFSNGRIRKGELYCYYRPFFWDLTTQKSYVLKRTIKAETAYIDFLPVSISEFDIFREKVENYWNYPGEILDYERINYNLKGDLAIQLLKTRTR